MLHVRMLLPPHFKHAVYVSGSENGWCVIFGLSVPFFLSMFCCWLILLSCFCQLPASHYLPLRPIIYARISSLCQSPSVVRCIPVVSRSGFYMLEARLIVNRSSTWGKRLMVLLWIPRATGAKHKSRVHEMRQQCDVCVFIHRDLPCTD